MGAMSQSRIPHDQLIMGVHPIQELLRHAPDRLIRIFAVRGRQESIVEAAESQSVAVSFTREEELTRMVDSDSHQSLVAHVKGRKFLSVKEFLENLGDRPALVVLLDSIMDPQNFGAILRSCDCFGVDGVVWSKNRGTDLTPIAAKTSCGASEWLPLLRVANLANAAEELIEGGFDAIATLPGEGAENLFEATFQERSLLMLGSEAEGLQPLLRKRATRSLYIPMQGRIQSLNVAQSAAVFLSHYRG